jgi:alpha-D-glucose phosphate-specific phosphoglucomutase
MSVITFGTDGWRGVIAKEFTFANVAIVAQAVAMYVKAEGLKERGVIVGYDNRFLGGLFAERVAEVLAANQMPVLLCDAPAPTPAVASMIAERKLAGAIMVTASHNPPEYNGIKFIPEYAGPATPKITDAITRYVREVEAGQAKVQSIPLSKATREGLVTYECPRKLYGERLKRIVDQELIRKAGLKVVIDPMHGVGIGYLAEIAEEIGVEVVEVLRNHADPLFGGTLPEPCAEELQELARLTKARGASLGIALDGDADRFGIIDPSGEFVTPNEVFALLTQDRLRHKGGLRKIARTVATTHRIDRMAEAYGVEVVETPVGFKYIGQEILNGAGIGGEESGGLSIEAHIPEKDGLLVGLMMLELIARTGRTPKELLAELEQIYGATVSERVDVRMTLEEKERVLATMRDWTAERLDQWHVIQKTAIDGVKLLFHTGAWTLVRPSGTEPLVRIYLEANDQQELNGLKAALLTALGLQAI